MTPAYIISAYKRPDLLVRLVEKLKESPIAIHIDKKSDMFDVVKLKLSAYPNVTFLPRHICYWGLFGHVKASIEGMKWFLGTSCDYAILLTGQCYPIKPNCAIEMELDRLSGRSIIEIEKFPRSEWNHDDGGYKRLNKFYFSADTFLSRNLRLDWFSSNAGCAGMLRSVQPWTRKPPLGLHPYGGSGYWCLSKKCVEYVLDYIKAHPEIVRFFSTTFVPDEMFFQTILANSPLQKELVNSTVHYIDWSHRKPNPAILGESEIPIAFASGAWFARKFDDMNVLDLIDTLREKSISPQVQCQAISFDAVSP